MAESIRAIEVSASPYASTYNSARALGIDSDATVAVERWTEDSTAQDAEQARALFAAYGAVHIDPTMRLVGTGQTVDETVQPAIDATLERVTQHVDNPDIVRPKNYSAYNGTNRHMFTISYPNVMACFKEVVQLQRDLLGTVRTLSGDSVTEASVDPAEGTVINLQLFDPHGMPEDRQQHGAHTDRVDTTVVVCLDNVGPNGELVFAHGYTEACEQLSLNPHLDFDANLKAVLELDPSLIAFRSHPVRRGSLLAIKSAEDIHFITPKTLADVQTGVREGKRARDIGSFVLGRGIINIAFETEACRRIDQQAREVEVLLEGMDPRTPVFYVKLAEAYEALVIAEELRKPITAAAVARLSAVDLYMPSSQGLTR